MSEKSNKDRLMTKEEYEEFDIIVSMEEYKKLLYEIAKRLKVVNERLAKLEVIIYGK